VTVEGEECFTPLQEGLTVCFAEAALCTLRLIVQRAGLAWGCGASQKYSGQKERQDGDIAGCKDVSLSHWEVKGKTPDP
jgi:hypothetical protein